MEDTVALLIGHGSRFESHRKTIEQLAESIRNKKIFSEVFHAFMNENEPSIKEAMHLIVKKGYRKIVAIPVFLSEGVHTAECIPKELGLENRKQGIVDISGVKVRIWYAKTIGYDDRLAEILIERGKEAIEKFE